ncbi:hypothetical protein MNBD_ALPHA12-712 [hydrothermal vent metagenome]|uniref:Lipopolysaccharide assembly protein A domain-containing protein n=1 Tax=hydrothermal vent metagenome TaxID=652676 RepID=A0A3B0U4J7_9ZZZZ
MFKRLVSWFILVPLSLLLVVFALANRQLVVVNFDPLPLQTPLLAAVEVPLFVVIYGVLIAGIFLGGFAAWFAQSTQRRQKRLWRRQARNLEKQRDNISQKGTSIKAVTTPGAREKSALVDPLR